MLPAGSIRDGTVVRTERELRRHSPSINLKWLGSFAKSKGIAGSGEAINLEENDSRFLSRSASSRMVDARGFHWDINNLALLGFSCAGGSTGGLLCARTLGLQREEENEKPPARPPVQLQQEAKHSFVFFFGKPGLNDFTNMY